MEQKLDILLVDDNSIEMLLFARAANKTHLKIRLQTLTGGRQAIDYLEAKGEYTDRSRHPLAGFGRAGFEDAAGGRF